MKSFFKKDNKEDKEKKKLEKRLIKESLSSLSSSTSSSLSSTSSSNSNNNHHKNNQNETNSTFSNYHQNSSTMNSDENTHDHDPKHNKVIETSTQLSTQLPPKPIKGILKTTMSKFAAVYSTHSATSHNNQEQPGEKNHLASTAPASPKTPSQNSAKIEITNYSKRNSQDLTQLAKQIDLTCSPKIKKIPFYAAQTSENEHDGSEFKFLYRSIFLTKSEVSELNLTYDLNNFDVFTIDSDNPAFLPADQLVSINEQKVFGKSFNEVMKMLNELSENEEIVLKVRTSLPFYEMLSRIQPGLALTANSWFSSSTSSSSPSRLANAEDDLNNVWFLNGHDYMPAKIFAKVINKANDSNEIKFKIRLPDARLIDVNEEYLEKANPSPQYDFCEDLSNLRFLNQTSLLHLLRQRYTTFKLVHSYIGSQSLVALRAPSYLQRTIYNDRAISMFRLGKQDDMPPHIYSYAQSVYRQMLSTRQDQSMIMMGHTASGKTQNSKFVLNYLFKVASSTSNYNASSSSSTTFSSYQNNFNEHKLNAMYCLLNAFCSIRSRRNPSGSNRALNVFLLEFTHSGQLASFLLQLITLDQTRLVYQPNDESNYLIFYYLLFGGSELLKSELHITNSLLGESDDNNLFFKNLKSFANEPFHEHFKHIGDSFKILNFTENEQRAIWSLLAAIVHLGRAGACKFSQLQQQTSGGRCGQFQWPNEAHKAANLLGISFNQLNDCVFSLLNANTNSQQTTRTKYSHLSNHGSSRVSPDPNGSTNASLNSPLECLQGFCIGLYNECCNLLVNCINRAFKPCATNSNANAYLNNQLIANSMLIIDPPGFQTKNENEMSSYSDLLCNYLSERFQLMFFQINFINPIEKYALEGLDIDLVEHIPESPSGLVNWFDKASAPILHRTPNSGVSQTNDVSHTGLLWLLEEQMLSENKSAAMFINKLIESDPKQHFVTHDGTNFTIYHQFAQYPIEYNVDEWLENYNKEYATQRNSALILQESKREAISTTFFSSAAMSNAAATLNSLSTMASSSVSSTSSETATQMTSLKRQASVRKMLTLSKRKTFTINFKLQIDSLFDSMRRTKCNFVFCLLPNVSHTSEDMDVQLMRGQLKAYQLLAACRMYRQGFPDCLNFEEFERRFQMFAAQNTADQSISILASNDEHKQACLNLVRSFDLDSTQFKLGTSQIFFKAGVLSKLEDLRDKKINHLIVKLQAQCRTLLAKKSVEKRKLQDSAIRCLQKNIRIYFALRQWPWWRLYTKLVPIVNVQSNEALLNQYKEELDELKRKNERLANEKNELKLLNNQLENKLMNLQTDYVEEHAANAGTIDLLEVETSERIRLEKELNELRPLYNESAKRIESLETEILELRLYNTKKSIEHELQKEDVNDTDKHHHLKEEKHGPSNRSNLMQLQLEKVKRENEHLKAQLRQEKEHSQMNTLNEKHSLEQKLNDRENESAELLKQVNLHKRKYQKLFDEMQDLQRMCDETKTRNRELEKQQLKFDADLSLWRNKFENERELREKSERERDASKYEMFTLKSELETQRLEAKFQSEKCERLERDIRDYETNALLTQNATTGSATPGNDQFMRMKSQIRDLESKLNEQEEELDEQAFQIQQLEQNKLRLEMQLEKEKQKWQRELAEKESEMDDLRFHTQKKIKSIEMQLEEESELSSQLQRDKRELERKLREYAQQKQQGSYVYGENGEMLMNGSVADYINKLKRQMLKYKMLAMDAQTQLEKFRETIPKQSIMKSLKSQLEDSEISKANALKAKQLLHAELDEVQQQLEDVSMQKQHLEEQNLYLNRELNNLKSQMEEQERETDDILKKYQVHMQNYTLDSNRFIDLNNQIDILTMENRMLKEKIREMEEKIMNYESSWVEKSHVNKLECRIRELEGKYELESTHKQRLMNQLERLKQQHESLMNEIEMVASREKKFEDNLKRSQRQNKELTEELGDLKKKVVDLDETRKRLEQENEILEKELQSFKSEIKINQNRLEAFQNAFSSMNEDDEDDEDDEIDEQDDDEQLSEQSGEQLSRDDLGDGEDIDEVYLNQEINSFNSSRKSLDNGHSFSNSISNAI